MQAALNFVGRGKAALQRVATSVRTEWQTRKWPWLALLVVLIASFAVRVSLTNVNPQVGDLILHRAWLYQVPVLGLAETYNPVRYDPATFKPGSAFDEPYLPVHGPVELILYGVSGRLYNALVSGAWELKLPEADFFAKLPANLTDLFLAVLIFTILTKFGKAWWGVLGAAVYALHPASLYDSAMWGQTDSMFTFAVLGAVVATASKRWAIAGACLSLAILAKINGVVIAPFLFFLWFSHPGALKRAMTGGAVVGFIVLFPFFFNVPALDWLTNVYTRSGAQGLNQSVSISAFNFWWGVFGTSSKTVTGAQTLLGILTYYTVAKIVVVLWHVAIILVARHHLKKLRTARERLPVFLIGATLAYLAFYLFYMPMLERYAFPVVALLLPVAFLQWRIGILYAFASLGAFLNMWGIYNQHEPIFQAVPELGSYIGLAQVIIFLLLFADYCTYKPAREDIEHAEPELEPIPLSPAVPAAEAPHSSWLQRLRWYYLIPIGLAIALLQGTMIVLTEPMHDVFNVAIRGNAPNFQAIMEQGYSTTSPFLDKYPNTAWFPGYPLAARAMHAVVGGDPRIVLLIVSVLASWLAWTYFLLLMRRWGVTVWVGAVAALLLLSYPGSFFLGLPHFVSLLLASILGCLYWSRVKWFQWLSPIHGALATAVHPLGLPLALFPIAQDATKLLLRKNNTPAQIALAVGDMLARSVATLTGAALYFRYLENQFGTAAVYWKSLEAWGNNPDALRIFQVSPRFFFKAPAIASFGETYSYALFPFLASLIVVAATAEWSAWKRGNKETSVSRVGLYLLASSMLVVTISFYGNMFPNGYHSHLMLYHVVPILAIVLLGISWRVSEIRNVHRTHILLAVSGGIALSLFMLWAQMSLLQKFLAGTFIA